MNKAQNFIYLFRNLPLALLAIFNLAVTLYCCTQFYAYLPTSDTWVHMDFLVQAANGHLDVQNLFEKHNGIHLIVLPKVIYFLDMWLTQGSGKLIVVASLLSMTVTAGFFTRIIFLTEGLNKDEKLFIFLLSLIFIFSASQSESLLNPANLQWALLVMFSVMTAFSFYLYQDKKTNGAVAGLIIGITGCALSSASMWLIIFPLVYLILCIRNGRKKVLKKLVCLTLCAIAILLTVEILNNIYFKNHKIIFQYFLEVLSGAETNLIAETNSPVSLTAVLSLYIFILSGIIKFILDFTLPSLERINSLIATSGGFLFLLFISIILWREKKTNKTKTLLFFECLMYFVIFIAIATGVVRSYSGVAFTYRFVNLGILFSLCLCIYSWYVFKNKKLYGAAVKALILSYTIILSIINVTEASAFGYGRNHIRLTQIAYALDLKEPYVVVSMPGTVWQDIEYKFIQENIHKLKDAGAGIYSDEVFKLVGSPAAKFIAGKQRILCEVSVSKTRRLLPEQAGYKLAGEAKTEAGNKIADLIFVDNEGTVRGFTIPIMPTRNIFSSLWQGKNWAGFANLDQSSSQNELLAYAYNGNEVCNPTVIELSDYKVFEKKNKDDD